MPGHRREEHRHVHQHEHETGGGQRLVDVEGPHRRPDREQLAEPAHALEQRRAHRRHRLVQHPEPVAGHRHEPAHPSRLVQHGAVTTASAREREREERERDDDRDHEAGQRPVRDLGRQQHVDDQQHHREEVEDAVREDRPHERRPRIAAPLSRLVASEHRDPRELPDAARQDGVREQADAECGEDRAEARPRRRHRLLDHPVPRARPREDGQEVEQDRHDHPIPGDEAEGVGDEVPVRPAPHEERDGRRERQENDREPGPRRPQQVHAATALWDSASVS